MCACDCNQTKNELLVHFSFLFSDILHEESLEECLVENKIWIKYENGAENKHQVSLKLGRQKYTLNTLF